MHCLVVWWTTEHYTSRQPSWIRRGPEFPEAKDATQDLADIAGQLASLKGEAKAWLTDPNYNTLKLRLESAHSAPEAAMIEARHRVR